jgi:bla regulator protein BlaR1
MTGNTTFLQSLGWAVLNSLWQLALLWVAYQFITAVFKSAKSSVKSSLASGLLIGGFAWFVYTFFNAYTSSAAEGTVVSSAFIATEDGSQVNDWLKKILPVASIVYLILLSMPLLRFIRNYRYVQIIRKYGLTKMSAEWRVFVSNIAGRMGIKKTVTIWISELVSSPVTIGFLKPVILIPLAAINNLTPQQLESVLLHELSHIKRYDYLINLIINFIRTIFYFNPFAKAFVQIVEREREKTCDETVLQFQYDSHEYATALLMLEKANHQIQPFIIAAVGNNDLLSRVETIMGVKKKQTFSYNKLAGLIAGLLLIVGLNFMLSGNKQNTENKITSIALLGLPAPTISATDAIIPASNVEDVDAAIINEHLASIENKVAKLQVEKAVTEKENAEIKINPEVMASFANFEIPESPTELKKYQEEQVREALEASKKVLTSQQWKEVEKNIAEVFTQKEKEELKATYQKEINKMDWKQWENKLRVAYDKVDWEKVNSQLAYAVNQVRYDSLQVVYNKALSTLDYVQKELTLNNVQSIPDTDITLKEVEQKKRETQRALNTIRGIRTKKIVSL